MKLHALNLNVRQTAVLSGLPIVIDGRQALGDPV